MLSNSSPARAFNRHEPIPGYVTVELLGRGGYGEVWRAVAPGGLAKAVKIVYGDVDSSPAATELRALSRIKDVRHPLLMSIERIEVVEGNLVIVMELADGSLKQHFQQLREASQIGVPQDELLCYINDAAEALDYLYEKHSLQHLDVKPENILVVSGRAKVGDFGLVKNLYERSASMVGGLTPTYSSPELFEGKPNRRSDQYSLAIVYMHMLTGVLPFTASNTAELATQHLRGVPDLTPLPKAQRSVIARALSKDPAQRFENCRAMIAALKDSLLVRESGPGSRPEACGHGNFGHFTRDEQTVASPASQPGADSTQLSSQPIASHSTTRQTTDPLSWNSDELFPEGAAGVVRPTVFVGVGGTGVEVLARLVQRLRDSFGSPSEWPPIQMLVLDTDSKSLSARFQEEDLARVQVVPIPLMSAESYGNQADNYLRWLNRRWFYNIPRDHTTGGFRPLGRLALLTHAPRVMKAISTVIEDVTSQALAAVPQSPDGQPPSPRALTPRVVVVGSISGGTGGGTLLDMAYALRGELTRRGLSDEEVHGVLLHSIPRGNADRDKARANAYATLKELHSFSRPGGYFPGEPMLGAPPFHGNNATFARTHILPLGTMSSKADCDLAAEQVAELLFCTTLTPAQRIFDTQSGADDRPETHSLQQPQARLYDVLALGAGSHRIIAEAARRACADLIHLWREGSQPAPQPEQASLSGRTVAMNAFLPGASTTRADRASDTSFEQLARFDLDLPHLLEDATEVVQLEVGGNVEAYLQKVVDDALSASRQVTDPPLRVDTIASMIDHLFSHDTKDSRAPQNSSSLYDQLVSRLAVRIRPRLEAFLEWLRDLVDLPEMRIDGTREMALATRQILLHLHDKLNSLAFDLREASRGSEFQAKSIDTTRGNRFRLSGWTIRRDRPEDHLRAALQQLAAHRLRELEHRVIVKIVRMLDADIITLVEQLDNLSKELTILAEPFQGADNATLSLDSELSTPVGGPLLRYQQMLLTQLNLQRKLIARKIEQAIDALLVADKSPAGNQHPSPSAHAAGALSATATLSATGVPSAAERRHKLRKFLDPEFELRHLLARPLLDVSRKMVLECLAQIRWDLVHARPEDLTRPELLDLVQLLADYRPQTITPFPTPATSPQQPCDPLLQRLLIVPDEADTAQLQQRLQDRLPPTRIIPGRNANITWCGVHPDQTLGQIAHDMVSGIDAYKELASRLHTRSDLTWGEFPPLTAVSHSHANHTSVPETSSPLGDCPTHTAILNHPRTEQLVIPQ